MENLIVYPYEDIPKLLLIRRTPVIIKLDVKYHYDSADELSSPFDPVFMRTMDQTMRYLCNNIHGCAFGYKDYRNIILVITDNEILNSHAWLDYDVQKMASASASMATFAFSKFFANNMTSVMTGNYDYEEFFQSDYFCKNIKCDKEFCVFEQLINDDEDRYVDALMNAQDKGVLFNSRVFNIPEKEVINYICQSQTDAIEASIEMVGRACFPNRNVRKYTSNRLLNMIRIERGINWDNFPPMCKRGVCCERTNPNGWVIDYDIPIFNGENRNYLESRIIFDE